jgi:hypothetical protein
MFHRAGQADGLAPVATPPGGPGAPGGGQTQLDTALQNGVSEGIRTPDIQDHNLAL